MHRNEGNSTSIANNASSPPVWRGSAKPNILLCSVFGPYARDDEYGSRLINPMELFHNQVTRAQGAFSLRMFHRSSGLMMLQANIDAPCTLLDYPTLDRFIEEIRKHQYDVVGIGAIVPHLPKVQEMCAQVRKYLPKATIVVGGHIASISNLKERIDADYVVKGDGITWFRTFLGQDPNTPMRHPFILSSIWSRIMGTMLKEGAGHTAAYVIPSAGCPLGCDFCCTSAFFGGKGRFVEFFTSGDELFYVMCELEKHLKAQSFFIMDENFLLYRQRTLRLLELMEKHNKLWALRTFTSAKVLASYSINELLRLGVSFVWLGLEAPNRPYEKLGSVSTLELVRELQSNGIHVLGSTIIGLQHQTVEDVESTIDWAIRHRTDFHQFMLYMPLPGTPLYKRLAETDALLSEDEFPLPDAHGQDRFNWRHPHIPPGEESRLLRRAFEREFEVNGPSVARMMETKFNGWKRHRNHPDPRVRQRIRRETRGLFMGDIGTIWATRRWARERGNSSVASAMETVLSDMYDVSGWRARVAAAVIGRIVYRCILREEQMLSKGRTYEPPTMYERNAEAQALAHDRSAGLIDWITIPSDVQQA